MAAPILIAGGGIGGLTLAMMLHEQGIPALVLEAAAEIRPLGVGINTLPHSIRELVALGLLDQLDGIGIRTRKLTYMNHLGQTIWSDPRGLFAGHDVPQFSVHRGRLQAMLWREAVARLGSERVRPGHRLVGISQHHDSVTARFETPGGTTEISMIEESRVLEYSGREYALVKWGSWMKLFLLSSIFMNVFVIPWGLGSATSLPGALLAIPVLLGKLALCGAAIVVIDTSFAKLRFFRIAEFLGAAFMLALVGVATSYVIGA